MEQLLCSRVFPLLTNMCVKCIFLFLSHPEDAGWTIRNELSIISSIVCVPPTTTPTASNVRACVSE